MTDHVPVVRLEDGSTFLLLLQEDLQLLPSGIKSVPVEAERVDGAISLWIAGRFEPTFQIDKEAELAIRLAGSLGIRGLTVKGPRGSGIKLDVAWPMTFASRRKLSTPG